MEQEFLQDMVSRVEQAGVRYAITGSIASNLWGTPRTTHDVDFVVVLSAGDEIAAPPDIATVEVFHRIAPRRACDP